MCRICTPSSTNHLDIKQTSVTVFHHISHIKSCSSLCPVVETDMSKRQREQRKTKTQPPHYLSLNVLLKIKHLPFLYSQLHNLRPQHFATEGLLHERSVWNLNGLLPLVVQQGIIAVKWQQLTSEHTFPLLNILPFFLDEQLAVYFWRGWRSA